ncbi:hypothetical protein JIN84_01015 [Luteolibacter yonseiensis]|uniref:Uncharacterized protein n=1 Tax=Luteolibacter yonseiensis TaxID=1144680 RepID=A0A934R2R7_9BACT|nr:hypothetical protein [Luteolibacter yonseiensis]MBK1814189.1 hypothetical protein [Luteolibacter yonseiensis]
MKNSWIIPVATLAVGAVGGYISGKGSESGGQAQAPEASSARTRSSNRPESSATSETVKKTRALTAEQIARMPGNSSRIQALLGFYEGLSAEQLAEEATKLDSLPMNERIMASILLFGRWAEVDPTAAMTFSNTMGFAGGFVRPTILQSWASVDPANAAKYYAENPREFAMMGMGGRGGPMGGGQDGASIIAAEWARQDPAAALAWASSLTNGKGDAMNSVITEMAKTDPRKAAGMISQMDPDDQAAAYRSVAAQYGALDFTEAQNWIRTLPADDQAAALASAIGGLSNTDPAAAAKQLASMPEGDARDRATNDVIGDLARVDPQAAADFLKLQESDRAQRDGMRELIPIWTSQNPAAASSYISSLPQGPTRDSAIGPYVWSNNTSPPKDLIALAESMEDDGDRERTVGVAYMRWMREDATAAKASIAASTVLSDEAKERLSNGGGMWGGGPGRGRRGGNN